MFKIPVVGEAEVGKTCLLIRFTDGVFPENATTSIGDDYKTKALTVNGSSVKLQVWDTAGQERFRTVTSSFYRAAKGIMLVIDLTKSDAFTSAKHWHSDIKRNTAANTPIYLIGNKADLTNERAIPMEQAKNFADNLQMKYFETSALTGKGVTEAFEALVADMIAQSRGGAGDKGQGGAEGKKGKGGKGGGGASGGGGGKKKEGGGGCILV